MSDRSSKTETPPDASKPQMRDEDQATIGPKLGAVGRRTFLGGAGALAASMPFAGAPEALAKPAAEDDGVLMIKKQGSFFVGGRRVQAPGTLDPYTTNANASDDGQIYYYDRLYAQFQIPPDARRYPLVLIHGGGGTGRVWETTPDGRQGFQSIFLRRGYGVYIVDFPRRGRASLPSFNGPFGELAGVPIVANRTNRSGAQLAFVRWRLGLEYPKFFPNSKFPKSSEALEQFFSHLVPTVDDPVVVVDGLVALVEKIGPCIVVTHSQSVPFGWQMAIRSSNVKGIIAFEGGSYFPDGEQPVAIPTYAGTASTPGTSIPKGDFKKLTKIPIRMFYGDGISKPSPFPGVDSMRLNLHYSKEMAKTVNRYKGDMSVVHLPKIGIEGNTHFVYSDTNNVKIADLMSEYFQEMGLDIGSGSA
ncbi:alpha/beta hydrolase [Hansschlegelia zhihuaiae]|uniref:Alpha/beta hydrolase n=1 Tax=Hansschlegelia zhihuaiae TaxID=405005 RepID=A0A4Q0MGY4_9HYPH|nr:alpha/beta fold hydrolase [Hansschlegelia zhihuaiae]RXF72674.1 alpha/beta hydrolase [Hansschlegelia zhihuaiae]